MPDIQNNCQSNDTFNLLVIMVNFDISAKGELNLTKNIPFKHNYNVATKFNGTQQLVHNLIDIMTRFPY